MAVKLVRCLLVFIELKDFPKGLSRVDVVGCGIGGRGVGTEKV